MAWFWLHGTRDQACPGPLPAFPAGCAITVPPRSPDRPTPGTLLPSLLCLCTHPAHLQEGGYDAQNWYAAIKNVLFEAVLHPRYSMKSTLVPSCLL